VWNLDSRDWCLYSIASDKKDISICKKINEEDIKNKCFFEVVENKKDK